THGGSEFWCAQEASIGSENTNLLPEDDGSTQILPLCARIRLLAIVSPPARDSWQFRGRERGVGQLSKTFWSCSVAPVKLTSAPLGRDRQRSVTVPLGRAS